MNIDELEEFTHLKEELSDVMIYCLSLANQLDIDVADAIEDKIEKNGEKYPIKQLKSRIRGGTMMNEEINERKTELQFIAKRLVDLQRILKVK